MYKYCARLSWWQAGVAFIVITILQDNVLVKTEIFSKIRQYTAKCIDKSNTILYNKCVEATSVVSYS